MASVFCFTLCVAISLLWVRSYWWQDEIFRRSPNARLELSSWQGGVQYLQIPGDVSPDGPLRFHSTPHSNLPVGGIAEYRPQVAAMGFLWGDEKYSFLRAKIPYWFVVLFSAIIAIALKPPPRDRISLFECISLTTFAAILAASADWLARHQG